MCLTINENFHKGKINLNKPIVIDVDILVWKCLDVFNGYSTPFMKKKIKFVNNIATQHYGRFTWGSCDKTMIAHGIHSYWSECESNNTADSFSKRWNTKNFCAVIPKGSKIFVGRCGDIVSDKLFIFKTDEDFDMYKKEHEVIRATEYLHSINKSWYGC